MNLLRYGFLRGIVCFVFFSLTLLFFTSRIVEAKSAKDVVREFIKTGKRGDFKKLADLCCKDSGPYTTFADVKSLDLGNLGYIDKVIREEKNEIDSKNVKLVVVRTKVLGEIGFYCLYVFRTQAGFKIYLRGDDFLYKYPPNEAMLAYRAAWFFAMNKLNLQNASRLAEYAVSKNYNTKKWHFRLGYIYFLNGNKAKAAAGYKKAIPEVSESSIFMEYSIEAWKKLVSDSNRRTRFFVAQKLYSKTKDKRAIPTMIEIWKQRLNKISSDYSYKVEYYKEAVKMLSKYQGKAAVPALINALKLCNWGNYQRGYKELGTEIIYHLGDLGDKSAIPTLIGAIRVTVKPMSSAAGAWIPSLAEALVKLEAKKAVPEIVEIMKKFLVDSRYTFDEVQPFLRPLSKFTGEPWSEIDWVRVKKTFNRLRILNAGSRGIISSYDEQKYLKNLEELKRISNPSNYEKIKNWVFPLKKRARSSFQGSNYKLTIWRYRSVKACDVKDDSIYIRVNRNSPGRTVIIDESLIILKIKNNRVEVHDIQKHQPGQVREKEMIFPSRVEKMILSIRGDSTMYFNQNKVTENNLRAMLDEIFAKIGKKKIYLDINQEQGFGKVVNVLNIIQDSVLETTIYIIADKKTEEILEVRIPKATSDVAIVPWDEGRLVVPVDIPVSFQGFIVFTLFRNNVILVNSEFIKSDMLYRFLKSVYEVNQAIPIFIRADAKVRFESVIKLIDIISKVGFKTIGILQEYFTSEQTFYKKTTKATLIEKFKSEIRNYYLKKKSEPAQKKKSELNGLGPVRAVGEIRPPRCIHEVTPIYPEVARQGRVEGVVMVEVTTDTWGRVKNVKILKSIPLLDQAAIDAVKQWVYESKVINGRPRGVIFVATVQFKLDGIRRMVL